MRRRHRILVSILIYMVCLSPIIYGLHLHGWDSVVFFSPRYTPPTMDFDVDFLGYRFDGNNLVIRLRLINLGELDVSIIGFDADLTTSEGEYIADLVPSLPVDVPSKSYADMEFTMFFGRDVMATLVSYFLSNADPLFYINGTVVVKVYSSKAYVPFNMGLPVPRELRDLFSPSLWINFYRFDLRHDGPVVILNVSNPTMVTWNLEDVDMVLMHINGSVYGSASLLSPVSIEAGSYKLVSLSLSIEAVDPISLYNFLVRSELLLYGGITLSIDGFSTDIDVNIPLQLTS